MMIKSAKRTMRFGQKPERIGTHVKVTTCLREKVVYGIFQYFGEYFDEKRARETISFMKKLLKNGQKVDETRSQVKEKL